VHESPWVMTLPLWLLAIPTVFMGLYLGLPLGDSRIHHWLEPVFHDSVELLHGEGFTYELFGIDGALILASVAIGTLGILVAGRLFGVNLPFLRVQPRPDIVQSTTRRVPFLYRASLNKWWFDDLNHLLFMRIGGRIAAALWWFDREVVDGIVNGLGVLTRASGARLSQVQTGRVQNYALGIAIGLIVMAGSYLWIAGQS
jgi:NADH:ubiquinone oxidoreductase subunit 5 (subunit L)/multisubunit Na+/H+ antiporter MnhA subunit